MLFMSSVVIIEADEWDFLTQDPIPSLYIQWGSVQRREVHLTPGRYCDVCLLTVNCVQFRFFLDGFDQIGQSIIRSSVNFQD